jgi:hypothetical protein
VLYRNIILMLDPNSTEYNPLITGFRTHEPYTNLMTGSEFSAIPLPDAAPYVNAVLVAGMLTGLPNNVHTFTKPTTYDMTSGDLTIFTVTQSQPQLPEGDYYHLTDQVPAGESTALSSSRSG